MNSSLLLIEVLILTYPYRDFNLVKKNNLEDEIEAIIRFIRKDADIFDLDEFLIIVNEYLKNEDLLSILTKISLSLVEHYDHKLYLRELLFDEREFPGQKDLFHDYGESYKMLIWYYFCRFISTDLILINYLVIKKLPFEAYLFENLSYLHIGDKSIRSILKKGLAENHVHLNGAIHFENQFWYLVGKKDTIDNRFKFLEKIGNLNRLKESNIDLEIGLLICILIRYYLISFLSQKDEKKLCDYLVDKEVNCLFIDFLEGNLNSIYDSKLHFIMVERIRNIIRKIEKLNNAGDDYISKFVKNTNIKGVINEYWFIYQCLNFLYNEDDTMFEQLFWCYIRVKNALFSMKIQSNQTKGLSYFKHFFSGQNGIIPLEDRYQIFFNYYKQLEFVKSVELRKSLPPTNDLSETQIYKALKKDVLKFVDVYLKWATNQLKRHKLYCTESICFGLVYHFKRTDYLDKSVCLKDYISSKDVRSLAYGKYQDQLKKEIRAIQKLRDEIPELKKYIVGIDVAGNEHYIDPSIFAPVYCMLRNNIQGNKSQDYLNNSIGLTYHAGEVFYSIVTSFRHIDEIVTKFKYKSFDRLGHGTALMIDLKSYLIQRKVSKLPVIEYLDNLLYIYILKSEYEVNLCFEPLELLRKIKKCTKIIYNDDNISIDILVKWYKMKFEAIDTTMNKYERCPLKCPTIFNEKDNLEAEWNLEKLVASRHCKVYLKKMETIISIKENIDDLLLYQQIQAYLRKKIIQKGIIIESNPISNARIGLIEDETKFLISEIYAKGLNEDHNKRVQVSLNSDDPAVFNTNLIYQYAILEKQLIENGYSKTDVDEWLDNMRKIGIKTTFIPDNQLIDIVEELRSIKKVLKNS